MRKLLLSLTLLALTPIQAAPFEDSIAQRALACTQCHGKEGRAGPDGYYPRLAGKPQGYLYNQLLNFRDGRRHYGLMTELIAPLSDAYLLELASYFASLDLPYPAARGDGRPAPALLLQGDRQRQLPACVACHGQKLSGMQPAIPGLLGLPRDYLIGQLGAWRTGQRRAQAPDCMGEIARRLRPEEVAELAQWLAAQPVPADYKPQPSAPLPQRCGTQP
ncbi:c-type cytochrome [Paucibacter sp. APW11]|uniref:C-type cytochrome n=1 Tax=Roseateles aquae TaxID=3077235 RepID=A0ABU3PI54_9BURK|nr:c-type cytochrome [Paucibacter sp. APW11]MDT9002208.1 c-type cytochrome [Paucibacter sp. APW11]